MGGLVHVILRGAAGVGVDVADVGGMAAHQQGPSAWCAAGLAIRAGDGHVVSLTGEAEAPELCIDAGAALTGVFVALHHKAGGAFAHDKAVAVRVEGAAGMVMGSPCQRLMV